MDYTRFRFRAVVDWIELEIHTRTATTAKVIYRITGSQHHIFGLRPDTGIRLTRAVANQGTTIFRLRVQDPNRWQELETIMVSISRRHDLACPPSVTAVEVALDAYSRHGDAPELAMLAAQLFEGQTNHVSANRRLYRDGTGSGRPVPLQRCQLVELLQGGHQIAIGNGRDDRYQHIYVKSTDTRQKQRVLLPTSEHRARTEIRLTGEGLPCHALQDWREFRFECLSAKDGEGLFHYRSGCDGQTDLKALLNNLVTARAERRVRNRAGGGVIPPFSGVARSRVMQPWPAAVSG